ncbi:MAG: hypothetical protein J6866_08515 [Victivallales bacterium]|nr:hypothetical protein [Victivallales bacterium]
MPKEPADFASTIEKLAPFLLRARSLEVGRDRLWQLRHRLAFLLLTTDISENSRDKFLNAFPCPVFQALTTDEISRLFGYQGTKALGFRRSSLSVALLKTLSPYRIHKPETPTTPQTQVPSQKKETT